MSLPPSLIARYLAHLGGVRDELARLRTQLEAGGDADALEQVRALVHKLVGTAEGYGFAAVGEQAREAQEALRRQPVASAELSERLRRLDGELGQAIAAAPD